MQNSKKVYQREEIDAKYKWRIHDLFESDAAWKDALEQAREYVPHLASYEGKIADNAKELLAFMRLSDQVSDELDLLATYAQRKSDEDTRVAEYQELVAQVMRFYVEVQQATAFEVPELMRIPEETLEQFYEQEPHLELYRLALKRIRQKKDHVLSKKEERILALTGEMTQSPDEIFSMFNDADLRFKDAVDSKGEAFPVTHGTYISLMQSSDRTLRKSAFESLYAEYERFGNTSAAILSSQMKQLLFFSNARRYDSTLLAALDHTEVNPAIYQNLIATIHNNMKPMHRYIEMRKKALGVEQLHMYDLYAPIISDAEMHFTFEEAKALALQALAPLGEDYLAILREGFDSGWIDVYENEGKRSGAYSAGAKVHPYVLLNFKGTLDDVFTLVHEMGHAIHSYLSNKYQPSVYSQYVIFVAEVASTCNEALLMEYLLKTTTDKKKRAYVLNHFLEQFRGTLYRQTMFAEFELLLNQKMQEGTGLTKDALSKAYLELQRKYFGEEIVLDPQIALEWSRIPHFYYNYYVYQYATGYAAAIVLSKRILEKGASAVKDYIGFLSSGNSKDPVSLLRGAGVDMSRPKSIEDAVSVFDAQLDLMEQLLDES